MAESRPYSEWGIQERQNGSQVSLIQAVQAMMQRGLFIVKGGVERAATALGVTRFTIYNYLEALRERAGKAHGAPAPAKKRSRA